MQDNSDGTFISILVIIVGLFVGIVGSYFAFIINSFRDKIKDCKENCTGRIGKVETEQNDLSKIVHEMKGAMKQNA